MKKALLFATFLLITCSAFAQVKTYTAEWKKATDFAKKNLPKSALVEVKKIYAMAKKDGQEAQVIKALVHMTELQEQTREDNIPQSIKELEAELATAKEPSASIIRSLIADLYWKFMQQHRYQLYNRTNTVNFEKDDIA